MSMTTNALRVAEAPIYAKLQRQIHHALRAQHPEWVQPDGNSPICDAYESRLAELLRHSPASEQRLLSKATAAKVSTFLK